MKNIVFKSVNWMQGMSVSSSHFIATENFLMERLMLNTEALQNKFGFGLLPLNDTKMNEEQMDLQLEGKGDGTRLALKSYRGITRGGCLVEITSDQSVTCECVSSVDVAEYGWDIVLSVSPFERRPCGEPDMHEMPPRYPFVDPCYKLSIVERDKEHVNEYGSFDVVVGLLRKKDGEFKLDHDYIPPSLAMSSNSQLRRYMDMFSQSISVMKNTLSVIMEKAYSSTANKSVCQENALLFCKELQRVMANLTYKWRNCGVSLSPYQVVELFGGMANTALTSLSFMSKTDKDELLKYFYEWNGVTPSAFEQILDDVATHEFSQNRIEKSMNYILRMFKLLEDLLVDLSKLDYVGQRKESMIISVSSEKEDGNSSKRLSWLL